MNIGVSTLLFGRLPFWTSANPAHQYPLHLQYVLLISARRNLTPMRSFGLTLVLARASTTARGLRQKRARPANLQLLPPPSSPQALLEGQWRISQGEGQLSPCSPTKQLSPDQPKKQPSPGQPEKQFNHDQTKKQLYPGQSKSPKSPESSKSAEVLPSPPEIFTSCEGPESRDPTPHEGPTPLAGPESPASP